MEVDKAGLGFLKEREDLKLTAYLDSGGVPTIGIGSIRMFGQPVQLGMTCTEEEAYAQCKLDISDVEKAINQLVTVPLTQNQFNALASFVYNEGIHAFATSTLLRKLNAGDILGAAAEFPRWNKVNGKVVAGLTKRRELEQFLFLS